MNKEQMAALSAVFPAECIEYLETAGTRLAYLSHSWVTQRLLEVDPEWSWEPLAFDSDGLPKFDENGGLWIRLTVLGVTRYGYGEPQGRDAFDKRKGAIGNALRVAAMRFGVGLYLWQLQPGQTPGAPAVKGKKPKRDARHWDVMASTDGQRASIRAKCDALSLTPDVRKQLIRDIVGREVTQLADLTNQDADLVIRTLEAMGDQPNG